MHWNTLYLKALDVFSATSISFPGRTSQLFITACGATAFAQSVINRRCQTFSDWLSTFVKFTLLRRQGKLSNHRTAERTTWQAPESIYIRTETTAARFRFRHHSKLCIIIKRRSSKSSPRQFPLAVRRWITWTSNRFSSSKMSSATCQLPLSRCSSQCHRDPSASCTLKPTSNTSKACKQTQHTSDSGRKRWMPQERRSQTTTRHDCQLTGSANAPRTSPKKSSMRSGTYETICGVMRSLWTAINFKAYMLANIYCETQKKNISFVSINLSKTKKKFFHLPKILTLQILWFRNSDLVVTRNNPKSNKIRQ